MQELSLLTPMQFLILSEDQTSAFIWPPGSSRPVVLEGRRILTADSPVHLYFSPSEIAAAVTRNEERRRPNASLSLWGRLRPWPEYQRCMGLIAALALFGASTAYSSFTQVISANDLIVAHFAGSLRLAFALFIACAIATFSIQLLPLSRSRTFAFYIMGWDIILLGMGCQHLTMPLLTTAPEDSRWRAFAGVLGLLVCVPIAITAVAAGISAFQMIRSKAQRACDRAAARLPAGDTDAAQAAAFLRTYDLYGGALEYLRRAFPGGEKPDAADFSHVLKAFLPAGAAYSQEAYAAAAGVHAFLRDAGRWYAVAEELRRRALQPHAAPPPLHERVRGLLILEKVFLRRALGKQTSLSQRPASPTTMEDAQPLSPPETPHVAIEVIQPDGQDQGSNPSRLNENLPPA